MASVNAIAKVRFSSGKPQRVNLLALPGGAVDLLCLEPRQQFPVSGPAVALYVVTGTARLADAKGAIEATPGHLLSPQGDCTLANATEQRLVCLRFQIG